MTHIKGDLGVPSSMSDRVELGPGLSVPPQGYGAMSLTDVYGAIDESAALATLTHAVEAGATFIDTANIYGEGRSERIIGSFLRSHRRDEVQLATKVGIMPAGEPGRRTATNAPAHIREQIDLSLGRLGTDHVDLYYLHRIDTGTPFEDSIGALAELVEAGKIRHIGLSEATGEELRAASAIHPIAAVQSEWSIVSRDVEAGVIPAARELGITFVSYSPLSRQWLTGHYDPNRQGRGDARQAFPRFTPEALRANQPVLEEVIELAREQGVTAAQLALAWLHARAAILDLKLVTIPGTRFAERVDENIAALGIALGPEAMARLEPLAGRVAAPRSFDPAWVSSGRETAGP